MLNRNHIFSHALPDRAFSPDHYNKAEKTSLPSQVHTHTSRSICSICKRTILLIEDNFCHRKRSPAGCQLAKLRPHDMSSHKDGERLRVDNIGADILRSEGQRGSNFGSTPPLLHPINTTIAAGLSRSPSRGSGSGSKSPRNTNMGVTISPRGSNKGVSPGGSTITNP